MSLNVRHMWRFYALVNPCQASHVSNSVLSETTRFGVSS